MTLTDQSPFPFGIHANKKMEDVPVKYLHWIWFNGPMLKEYPENAVHKYIVENLSALKKENEDLIW